MDFLNFIGRSEVQQDIADPGRFAGLRALLDRDAETSDGCLVPPLGHFLCFPPHCRQSLLGADGHPQRTNDGLLPAVDLPRRMWAGSDIRFLQPVPQGARLTRRSTVIAVKPKEGRSGKMLFVTLRHEIAVEDGCVAIVDDQDLVYRAPAGPAAPREGNGLAQVDPGARVIRTIVPDPVLLFRYSALTFNAHRIHYDRPYAVTEENYPGLVVHGPLIATLLIDSLLRARSDGRITAFRFRGVGPAYDGDQLALCAEISSGDAELNAYGPAGLVMQAHAEFE